MHYVEAVIIPEQGSLSGRKEVVFVESVGYQLHGRRGHGGEVVPDRRRYGYYGIRAVKHGLLQPVVAPVGIFRQPQMLVVEHLRPRIPEIGYPLHPCRPLETEADKVHRMGRAGSHHGVYGVPGKILLQEPHRRSHPADPGVGNEKIAPERPEDSSGKGTVARTQRIDLGGVALRHEPAVKRIRLPDRAPYDLGSGRYVAEQASVPGLDVRVGRREYYGLPAVLGQILAEFHPALHAGAACGRPVICDYEQSAHNIRNQR